MTATFNAAVRAAITAEGFLSFEDAAKHIALKKAKVVVCMAMVLVGPTDGDYKDNAAKLSDAIQDGLAHIGCRRFRKEVAKVLTKHNLLDGYSAPRAFWEGWGRMFD